MAEPLDDFVALERTFQKLTVAAGDEDDSELARAFGLNSKMSWPDLLSRHRTIILSEAGSGKTTEIRHVAEQLRLIQKHAFFVRLENIVAMFEDAFEVGSIDDFTAWVGGVEEGWILLDSVDEARLRDPKDFERAIKKLGRLLASAFERAHIVITSRTAAWRASTDLKLCCDLLPYRGTENSGDDDSIGDRGKASKAVKETPVDQAAPFLIVALDDLHGEQIDAFLRGKKVADPVAFKAAVERKEVMSLTTRPKDLTELVEFWIAHRRIGSRLELLRSSIDRRLMEHDQDRSELRPIAPEKLRNGVLMVAAATTLTRESSIRVPDGVSNSRGISIRDVLPQWDETDCASLLNRPIFDNGIYGTVRFHHRSVREYLTAEWLHKLIVNEASRARIEALFFRWQYGIEVIVPSLRPVLTWLAILDERILEKVCRIAPEVIFEGGDPSQLPQVTRSRILRQVCEQFAQPARSRSLMDHASVQRFANADLTADLKALFVEYSEDDDIVSYLLRMVSQGEIVDAAPEAKHLALTSREKYTRIFALRALAVVGSNEDKAEVRDTFLADGSDINRDWMAEILHGIAADAGSVEWVLSAVERTPMKEAFEYDGLLQAMLEIATAWPLDLLPRLIEGMFILLVKPPFIKDHYAEISERYSWLARPAAQCLVRLARAKDPRTLGTSALSILQLLPILEMYGEYDLHDIRPEMAKAVTQWTELNLSLFWHDVARARAARASPEERITAFFQAGIYGHFWAFAAEKFDDICAQITTRPFIDDRLVALTLAFAIYRENGKKRTWRNALVKITKTDGLLKSALDELLHPSASIRNEWHAEQVKWKRRAARQEARLNLNKERWKQHLENNVNQLRDSGMLGIVTNGQAYLSQRTRTDSDNSGKWSNGNWTSLISEYGDTVARAFRDGAVGFWRGYSPKLLSEGATPGSTPLAVIFGLTGLAIEARETDGWPRDMSIPDVANAIRYALSELNGFANWLPSLYRTFPQPVIDSCLREIDHELRLDKSELTGSGVLYAASWSGDWIWDRLAPHLVDRLQKPPKSVVILKQVLNIIQGSSLDSAIISKLAARKAKTIKSPESAPVWFAVWVGVEPSVGIPVLAARLAETLGADTQCDFAMRFLVTLSGSRGERGCARQGYRTVEHAKALYLLMNEYIREEKDIDRVGKGAYSPQLRDNAQDARNALLSFIKETPGKDAYLALIEISDAHPREISRPWIALSAREKATLDADPVAWSTTQVQDFYDRLDRVPSNHRDLWYLGIDRLTDLKMDLEDGDSGIASILKVVERETELRKYIGNWCREKAAGRYTIPQEEELADAKRPDFRIHGIGFDAPVPVELKVADNWRGPHLFERLEVQLCGDYLRDRRSSRGIFLLVYCGSRPGWEVPNVGHVSDFSVLVDALQKCWLTIAPKFPNVEDIQVIGIDLTKRGARAEAASAKRKERKEAKAGGSIAEKKVVRKKSR